MHKYSRQHGYWPLGHIDKSQSVMQQQPEIDTVCCALRSEYLRGHRETIYGQWQPKFVVVRSHNILEVTEQLFTGRMEEKVEEWKKK